jgi:hypothetical protein
MTEAVPENRANATLAPRFEQMIWLKMVVFNNVDFH